MRPNNQQGNARWDIQHLLAELSGQSGTNIRPQGKKVNKSEPPVILDFERVFGCKKNITIFGSNLFLKSKFWYLAVEEKNLRKIYLWISPFF